MSTRPTLSNTMSLEEFQSWYWLKEELVNFCRANALPRTGSKTEIALVISAHLQGRTPARPPSRPRRTTKMPTELSPKDVIGQGWTCSVALGNFFRRELGNTFRFNKPMRDFIHHGAGRTLAEAVSCYQTSLTGKESKPEIAPVFEFNRHMRSYYEAHPKATRQDVIEAWWMKRKRSVMAALSKAWG